MAMALLSQRIAGKASSYGASDGPSRNLVELACSSGRLAGCETKKSF
ncbi:hypothetical protein [Ectothiorhodospira sp. BSL-9]|nr:hypothetical protein [Ectothiorhodospira sp. BSL-9]